jgi:hypothetical protein
MATFDVRWTVGWWDLSLTTVATSWVEPHSVRPPSMQFERAPHTLHHPPPNQTKPNHSPPVNCLWSFVCHYLWSYGVVTWSVSWSLLKQKQIRLKTNSWESPSLGLVWQGETDGCWAADLVEFCKDSTYLTPANPCQTGIHHSTNVCELVFF